METIASEILISARQVTEHPTKDRYEFTLNDQLKILECVRLYSIESGSIQAIRNIQTTLKGMLFELKHVRVNPALDNSHIIEFFKDILTEIGIRVFNQPQQNTMAICFKPLGEISGKVRFYLNEEGRMIFLSPSMRPKLIHSNPKVS